MKTIKIDRLKPGCDEPPFEYEIIKEYQVDDVPVANDNGVSTFIFLCREASRHDYVLHHWNCNDDNSVYKITVF